MTMRVLVVAKAPVPGYAKTRLGAEIGMARAAEVAAAALLDTLRTCVRTVGVEHCRIAWSGDLRAAAMADRIGEALQGWRVVPQRGERLDERLANAHLDLADEGPGAVVQIGMDTPQLRDDQLLAVARRVEEGADAVLADAVDGGWWALALADPRHGSLLRGVAMSTPSTGRETRRALQDAGLGVAGGPVLRDVDTAADADAVADDCGSDSQFARAWRSG